MMKSPVLGLASAFALGILLARAGAAHLAVLLPAGTVCLAAACLSIRAGRVVAAGALVLAGFVFAGAADATLFQGRFPPNHISHLEAWGMDLARPLRVEGMVATQPLLMPYGLQFDLAAARISDGERSHSATGKIRLRILNGENSPLPAASLQLHYGETIKAWARLRRPQDDQNPGGFDYRGWMATIQDIYWQGVVEGIANVGKTAGPGASLPGRALEEVRERLLASINRIYPPWSVDGRDGAVLKAILLGDRSSLDSSTVEDFRKSGLYHLLVVAGLHVGLLVLLLEGLLRTLRIRETWRVILLLAFLGLYAMLVDERAPTLRASLMIAAYLVARLLDRSQPAMNAIGIAALVLLFRRPAWLFDSGFELSFAAALLIAGLAVPALERLTEPYRRALRGLDDPGYDVAFEPRVAQFRLDIRDLARALETRFIPSHERTSLGAVSGALRFSVWVAELVIFSAILQLGLLLPMAAIFHRVTLAGIGLNALAVPLMTALLGVAVPVVLLGVVSPTLAALVAPLLAAVMKGLFALTEVPRLPRWLSFRAPSPPVWVALCFALAVVVAAYGLHFHRVSLAGGGAAAAAFGIVIALHPFAPRIPSGVFQITQLDCGGGEGLFIVLPDRTTVLEGACGGARRWFGGGDPLRSRRWDPGENVVSPYLWSRGIKTIDVLLLTDGAGDRLNGVPSVLKNFRVRQFWHGELPRGSESAALLELLESRGVETRNLVPGVAAALGVSRFAVLRHSSAPAAVGRGRTAARLMIRMSNREGSLLLAGDLTRSDQDEVLKSKIELASTVLEVSNVRPEWVSRVNPAVVLENPYGRNPIGALERADAGDSKQGGRRYLNVRDSGAVTVSMRMGTIELACYKPRPRRRDR